MKRGTLCAVAVAVAVVGLLASGVADAEPIGDPVKVELPSPAPGVADPFDPPTIAMPDPALAALELPDVHPWMLFDTDEAASRYATISAALAEPDPSTAQQTLRDSWLSIKRSGDACCTDRDSIDDAFNQSDFEAGRFGRSDLAELGILWHFSGDDSYLAKAKDLLQYLVGLSPDYGAPKEPGVDEYYIQRAHRLNGLALAYDMLHPGFDDTERAELRHIVEVLADQIYVHSHTAWWGTISSGSNIGAHGAASLGVAGLALYDEVPEARAWLVRGEQLVRSYLHDGFDPEGAGFEGILYGNYGLRIITFLEASLSRAGAGGLFHTGGIDKQQEWFAYELLPGGGAVNPINDARYYEINPSYTTWATTHGDSVTTTDGDPTDLSRWLFDNFVPKMTNGRSLGETIATVLWYEPLTNDFSPEQVLRLAEDYADRGLVHVRSGWGADDFMASFEARQNDWGEGVHQDSNVNSFTLYDGPSRLIVDSRYANWLSQVTAGKNEAARTSNSEAHNYIVADGRSQDFHGKGDLVAFASTAVVGDPGAIDVAVGDARLAWLTDQPLRADRVFTHLRSDEAAGIPDYVLLTDSFEQGDGDHDYTSYFHTEWNNDMHVRDDFTGVTITPRVDVRDESPDVDSAPMLTMQVVAAGPGRPTYAIDTFTPDDGQDWRSLNNGANQRRGHDRLSVTKTGRAFEAFTVLFPHDRTASSPTVLRQENGNNLGLTVDGGTWQDHAILTLTGKAGFSLNRFTGSGDSATVRVKNGEVWAFALVDGRSLSFGWEGYVLADRPVTVAGTRKRVDVDPGDARHVWVTADRDAEIFIDGVQVQTLYNARRGSHYVHLANSIP